MEEQEENEGAMPVEASDWLLLDLLPDTFN